MNIKSFVFNSFYENTYILSSEKRNAYIIDPGCYESHEVDELIEYVKKEKLSIKGILNTHCHIDHVLGNQALKTYYNVPLMIPKHEKSVFDAVVTYAPQWGITGYQHAAVDIFLEENQALTLDEVVFHPIEVSGHSPGHLMFYVEKAKLIIGGDVLFRESIGRTDLPGGNQQDLISNIQNKVYVLPERVMVYPGHGPPTTIGYERKNNPFVRG